MGVETGLRFHWASLKHDALSFFAVSRNVRRKPCRYKVYMRSIDGLYIYKVYIWSIANCVLRALSYLMSIYLIFLQEHSLFTDHVDSWTRSWPRLPLSINTNFTLSTGIKQIGYIFKSTIIFDFKAPAKIQNNNNNYSIIITKNYNNTIWWKYIFNILEHWTHFLLSI